MRVTAVVLYMRFIGAAGVGSYLGAATAGLIAVITGSVFAPGSIWAAAVPGLALLGALLTTGVARLTRFWLLPSITHRRTLWGAAAGAVLTPLAVGGSQPGVPINLTLLLMLIGSIVTAVLWTRWFRATHTVFVAWVQPPVARPRRQSLTRPR
ncbi:hypothetical protein [Umezawaea sp. Da 62-37]|uniref:hypothetical protein n=1 Tax=Umezawaea sp. Da 62-37 TaxID=3075927 RepID=UPI0028F6FA2E|nr:hypothetical protein [Umezawaea sp. Da 62-37]WNV83149.1 hypothetical protein RM788_33865 [Umezawaea sp. Da 62-37]